MIPYTKPEAAMLANVSERTIGRRIAENCFKAQKIDGLWAIDREDFRRWLAAGMPRQAREETVRGKALRMCRQQRAVLGW